MVAVVVVCVGGGGGGGWGFGTLCPVVAGCFKPAETETSS